MSPVEGRAHFICMGNEAGSATANPELVLYLGHWDRILLFFRSLLEPPNISYQGFLLCPGSRVLENGVPDGYSLILLTILVHEF